MEKRYRALRIIGTIYKVLGIIVAILTILAVLGVIGSSIMGRVFLDRFPREFVAPRPGMWHFFGGIFGGLITAFFMLLYGGGLAVTLYAFGEAVYLVIAIEENTRATVTLLREQRRPAPSPSPPPEPDK